MVPRTLLVLLVTGWSQVSRSQVYIAERVGPWSLGYWPHTAGDRLGARSVAEVRIPASTISPARRAHGVHPMTHMEQIDSGDIHINNIIPKMQMMKALIDELKNDSEQDFISEKERNANIKQIYKIQTRLNNYQYKYDCWINEMVDNVRP